LQLLYAWQLERCSGLLQYPQRRVQLESSRLHLVRTLHRLFCISCTNISSAAAASLVELVEDDHPGATREEAQRLMEEIPKLTKKIAGKSLPIEKLCSRKARKFHSQENRLFLPAMELAYVFGSLSHTPRNSLLQTLLPRIDRMLGKLEASEPEAYGNGHEYWDGESPYQRWDGRR
jgi:hypothetical protein